MLKIDINTPLHGSDRGVFLWEREEPPVSRLFPEDVLFRTQKIPLPHCGKGIPVITL